MALLSDLVRIVAEIEGLEEVSVGIFARTAREAGHITQGGRGRSAAKMSFRDASNLLIAVNGCALAKEIPSKLPGFRTLPVCPRSRTAASDLGKQTTTFGKDFETILEMMSGDNRTNMPGETFIRFFKPFPAVEIRIHPWIGKQHVDGLIKYEDENSGSSSSIPDRSDETVISHVTLQHVARLIAG